MNNNLNNNNNILDSSFKKSLYYFNDPKYQNIINDIKTKYKKGELSMLHKNYDIDMELSDDYEILKNLHT